MSDIIRQCLIISLLDRRTETAGERLGALARNERAGYEELLARHARATRWMGSHRPSGELSQPCSEESAGRAAP